MRLLQKKSVHPDWKYEGKGGLRSICKIYGMTVTHEEMEAFFSKSTHSLNESSPLFTFGAGLLYSRLTDQYLDFYGYEVNLHGTNVKYLEATKDSPQGSYYESSLEIDPDSDSLDKWLQELNSHQRPTIFVLVYSQGGGRVIGNYNGGPLFSSKYDAGGKKRSQGRDIIYDFDSHHPSYYIEDTGAEMLDGYIVAEDIGNHYYSDVTTGEAYFSNKFNNKPHSFVFDSGKLYFRVPRNTKIIDQIFHDISFEWKFTDANGLISEIFDVADCFKSTGKAGQSEALFKNLKLNNCTRVFNAMKLFTANKITLVDTNTHNFYTLDELNVPLIQCFENQVFCFTDIDIPKRSGTITVEFTEKNETTASFISLGVSPWIANFENILLKGIFDGSFNNSRFGFKDLSYLHAMSGSEDMISSFCNNTMVAKKVLLYGRNMTTSFQGNTNVVMDLIETCNTATNTYITGYFDNTTNLTIKGRLGRNFWRDHVADEGFNGCSGTLQFKTGYNTINSGGVEGDVAQILANVSGTPTVLYNQ